MEHVIHIVATSFLSVRCIMCCASYLWSHAKHDWAFKAWVIMWSRILACETYEACEAYETCQGYGSCEAGLPCEACESYKTYEAGEESLVYETYKV